MDECVADDQKYLEESVYPNLVASLHRTMEAAQRAGVVEHVAGSGDVDGEGQHSNPNQAPHRGPLAPPYGAPFDPLKFLAEDLMRRKG